MSRRSLPPAALLTSAALLTLGITAGAAPVPGVELVLGPAAPPLERLAAQELAGQFRRLFGVQTRIGTVLPPGTAPLILLGSEKTNPALKTALAGRSELTTAGRHYLVSTRLGRRPALVVGGAEPVGTLWAAYELGYHFGVRYLLYGDAYPTQKPQLKLDGIQKLFTPGSQRRAWLLPLDSPAGPGAWGPADLKRLVGQLARLKFNELQIRIRPDQPFLRYTHDGVASPAGSLWGDQTFPVGGDTGGRAVFGGATEFQNPALAGKGSPAERFPAGRALLTDVLATARSLGMKTTLELSPLEFPREFGTTLSRAQPLSATRLAPGAAGLLHPGGHGPDEAALRGLAAAQIRSVPETYPGLDGLILTVPEPAGWEGHAEAALRRLRGEERGRPFTLESAEAAATSGLSGRAKEAAGRAFRRRVAALGFLRSALSDPALLRRPGPPVTVGFAGAGMGTLLAAGSGAADGAREWLLTGGGTHRLATAAAGGPELPAAGQARLLDLADGYGGLLPQLSTTPLHTLVQRLRSGSAAGFAARCWIVGDQSEAAHYLSRTAWNEGPAAPPDLTPLAALHELVTPICGEGVADSLAKGYVFLEEATALLERQDPRFASPTPDVVMKQYRNEPLPAWWADLKGLYLKATDEMYRANTRARGGARSLSLYHAKRLEFATGFLTSLEAVRLAGIAKGKGDRQEQTAQLEKAVETMYAC
ncbi:MAG: hypothetical protein FJX77_01480, partial [Armatimonadetes bacterium]|nr:hypothetical protein [Armatimonadota bacterium]